MRKLIIAVAMVAITSPALAGMGTWYEDGRWIVEANSDYQYCTATTTYNNGRSLSIGILKGDFKLFITQTSAQEGGQYKVYIGGDKGVSGHLTGRGIGKGTVVFEGLTSEAVYHLAKNKRFYVDGIGSLEMTGSYRAISKAIECEKAMRELL